MITVLLESVGWVLVHTVWQFAALAILAWVLLRMMASASAASRYAALLAVLVLMAICPVVTLFSLPVSLIRGATADTASEQTPDPRGAQSEIQDAGDLIPSPVPRSQTSETSVVDPPKSPPVEVTDAGRFPVEDWYRPVASALQPWLGLISGIWAVGVILFSVRLVAGWRRIETLKRRRVSPADSATMQLLERLVARLNVRHTVTVLSSELIDSPVVVGCFRSVILLPVSFTSGIPASQLEAILAHELAHVRRYDFLVNLAQTLCETLYFYHPAVWWLSAAIRAERESCCDEFVVARLDNKAEYCRALLAVEEFRSDSSLALGVRDGALLSRVRRLLTPNRNDRFHTPPLLLAGSILLSLAVAAISLSVVAFAGDDPADVASDFAFGPATDGLRLRIIPLKPDVDAESPDLSRIAETFKTAEDMTFAVEWKNVSDQPLSVAGLRHSGGSSKNPKGELQESDVAPHLFDFEFTDAAGRPVHRVRREFYQAGFLLMSASAHELAPGESLIELLRLGKFLSPMNYELAPGKYQMRAHYRGIADSARKEIRKIKPDAEVLKTWNGRATSNPVSFTVASAGIEQPAHRLRWGEEKNGLQAAIEFRPPDRTAGDPTRAPGIPASANIGVLFHVRNVSERAIRFISETGRQGDTLEVKDADGNPVETKDTFFTGWPIDIAWTLQPGDTAKLNLLSPAINTLDQPGRYSIRYGIRFNSRTQTDKNGVQIFPRPGDYQEVLRTGVTPLVLRAETDGDEEGEIPSDIKVEVNEKVSLEFLRLFHPEENGYGSNPWNADGSPDGPDARYPKVPRVNLASENPPVAMLLRVQGLPKDLGLKYRMVSLRTMLNPDEDGMIFLFAEPDEKTSAAALQVGVPDEQWGPVRKLDTKGELITPVRLPPAVQQSYATIRPYDVQARGNQVRVRWTHDREDDDLAFKELFAIDKQGERHRRWGVTIWEDEQEVLHDADIFDLPLTDIDHFEYRLLPIRHWVTFENVSLRPGHQTEVKTSTRTVPIPEVKDSVSYRGRILLPDGSVAESKGFMYLTARSENGTYFGTVGQFQDRFDFESRSGTVSLAHFPAGNAPAWTEPFETAPGDLVEGLVLTLKPGTDLTVRVQDQTGQAVPQATLVAHPLINGSTNGPVFKHTADRNGRVELSHLADTKYTFRVEAAGHETFQSRPMEITAGGQITLALTKAAPTTGSVLDHTGKPAAGAKLRAKIEHAGNGTANRIFGNDGSGFFGEVLATTDSSGRFTLDGLSRGSHYLFIVESADGSRLLLRNLQAGQKDVEIRLPERRDLRIHFRGLLGEYFRTGTAPSAEIRQRFTFTAGGQSTGELVGDRVTIEPNASGGTLTYRGLVVDAEADFSDQVVEVSLGTEKRLKQSLQLSDRPVTSHTVSIGPVPKVPIEFPTAQRTPFTLPGGRSGILFHSGDHVHCVLLHDGFLQTGLSSSNWGDRTHHHLVWRFTGKINAFSEEHQPASDENVPRKKRTYSLELEYEPPNVSLKIDDSAYDLNRGRIVVLNENGIPAQLNGELPKVNGFDDAEELGRFESRLETALANWKTADQQRRPWRVIGRVTDEKGKPLEAVTVRAATGWGTLIGGGSGKTDENGRYDVRFGPGILFGDISDPEPDSQTQYALISASLDGYFEKNLNRQGNGIASLKPVSADTLKSMNVTADQVCLPDTPREVDFLLLPAAQAQGIVVGANGEPLADHSVSLTADELPPGRSVFSQVRADAEGRFAITGIPTSLPVQLVVRKPSSELKPPWNDSWASPPIRFHHHPGDRLSFPIAPGKGEGSAVAGETYEFRLKISGEGVHDRTARADAKNRSVRIESSD